jgi:hypothetical protein
VGTGGRNGGGAPAGNIETKFEATVVPTYLKSDEELAWDL